MDRNEILIEMYAIDVETIRKENATMYVRRCSRITFEIENYVVIFAYLAV